MALTKKNAKDLLQRDYVPNGDEKMSRKELAALDFRKTLDCEIHQCGMMVGFDPQSGPLFCGDIAEYVAFTDHGSAVCLCEKHRPA